jgi:hypothetical protein
MRSNSSDSFSGARGFAATRLSTVRFSITLGAALRFFGTTALGAFPALRFLTASGFVLGFEAAAFLGAFFAPVLLRVRTKILQSIVAVQRDGAGLVLPISLPAIALHPKAALS